MGCTQATAGGFYWRIGCVPRLRGSRRGTPAEALACFLQTHSAALDEASASALAAWTLGEAEALQDDPGGGTGGFSAQPPSLEDETMVIVVEDDAPRESEAQSGNSTTQEPPPGALPGENRCARAAEPNVQHAPVSLEPSRRCCNRWPSA